MIHQQIAEATSAGTSRREEHDGLAWICLLVLALAARALSVSFLLLASASLVSKTLTKVILITWRLIRKWNKSRIQVSEYPNHPHHLHKSAHRPGVIHKVVNCSLLLTQLPLQRVRLLLSREAGKGDSQLFTASFQNDADLYNLIPIPAST